MDTTHEEGQPRPTSHYVDVRQMAAQIPVSKSFLDKDALGPQRIPFVRLGDRRLYHPPTVFEALKALQVGGPQARRTVRGGQRGR